MSDGHVYPQADKYAWGTSWKQRPMLFHNKLGKEFENVPAVEGTGLAVVIAGRGMRTAYIALGSNLASRAGPPEATLVAAASSLASLGRLVSRSSLYSTKPVGFADQPRFLNAVLAVDTELEPQAVLAKLLSIEQEYGRDRAAGIPNGPRTLDLDILLLGDLKISRPGLEIPHPRLAERAFVLIPLHASCARASGEQSRSKAKQHSHDDGEDFHCEATGEGLNPKERRQCLGHFLQGAY